MGQSVWPFENCAFVPAAWQLVAAQACAAGDCGLLGHICTEGLRAQELQLQQLAGGPWAELQQEGQKNNA